MRNDEIVSVRYMVDDVVEAIAFYTRLVDFELLTSAAPAFSKTPPATSSNCSNPVRLSIGLPGFGRSPWR